MAKDPDWLEPAKSAEVISIVGMSSGGAEFFNHAEGWSMGVNLAALWYPTDVCIHMDDLVRDEEQDKDWVTKMRQIDKTIITSKCYWDNHVDFPLDKVVADVWPGHYWPRNEMPTIFPPLENTISYAIALAVYCKPREIHIMGCDFQFPDLPQYIALAMNRWHRKLKDPPAWFAYHDKDVVEWRRAREPGLVSTSFLLGVAHARGIRIKPYGTTLDVDRAGWFHGYQEQP